MLQRYVFTLYIEKTNFTTLHVRRLQVIACEVFKSINDLNFSFMKEMFKKKDVPYDLSDSQILCQPIFKKITWKKHI